MNAKLVVACSFCRKSGDDAKAIIAGPTDIFICDECVDMCAEIVAERRLLARVRKVMDEIWRTVEPDEIGKP